MTRIVGIIKNPLKCVLVNIGNFILSRLDSGKMKAVEKVSEICCDMCSVKNWPPSSQFNDEPISLTTYVLVNVGFCVIDQRLFSLARRSRYLPTLQ